uniref:Uncharacterized protein LOC111106871 isoform X2 n=1 Tax=Crassostrea virginica TaxID=6565 RepID=A0A8B8B320_CRAVI|nr:uncharacterized protein LOC111106871 isoform X2 [Crassostrea virginica]
MYRHGYRFDVYPVNECPMNKTAFDRAAIKMNCTGRYLCAPNKDLTNLIEFCTDQNPALYGKGNCVRLEGTGNLNHYNCSKFDKGCPHEPYVDEEIYKYPACLRINTFFQCFVSEKGCPVPARGINTKNQRSKRETVAIFITFCVLVVVVMAIYLLYCRRKVFQGRSLQLEFLDNDEIDKDQLRQFLKEGQLTICHARCIIVGCDKAGKTTLLRRLGGATLKEVKKIKETKLLNVHANDFEVVKDENTIKRIQGTNADMQQTIIFSKNEIKIIKEQIPSKQKHVSILKEKRDNSNAEMVESDISSQESQMEQYEDERNLSQIDSDEIKRISNDPSSPHKRRKTGSSAKSSHENNKEDATETNDLSDMEKVISNETPMSENYTMQKCLDNLRLLSKSPENSRITFLDFAGQSIYYAFHQIYLSPKAVYILVLDMSKSFDEKGPDIARKDVTRFEEWTYKDYYTFWLKSIDSFSGTKSPVIVVGTHEDKMHSMDPKKFFDHIFELFNEQKDLERHINSERCFPIGFPKTGSKLDDLREIKSCIASIVQTLPYWKENVTPKWALFEQQLREKILNKIVKRKELSEHNAALPIDFQLSEDGITEALKYLNRVGSVLYNDDDENIRDTVILDVQWFVDAFTCIIIETKSIKDFSDSDRKNFHETGELTEKQLEAIWKSEGKEYLRCKKEILFYMENLGLVAICNSPESDHSIWYYFPSLNKRKFNKTKNTPKKFTPSSILCFQFDEKGQFPVFVFYALVANCNRIDGWEILVEDKITCIYEKLACFSYDGFIIILSVCKFQIQVQVFTPPEYDTKRTSEICVKVQASVETEIQKFKKYVYEIGYKCQNAELCNEKDDSFIGLEEFPTNHLLCRRCTVAEKHLVDDSVCWIKKSEHDILDTELKFDNSKEITDEGLVSLRHIFRDSLRGNIANFLFHLKKEIGSRKELLNIVTEKGWNLMHCAAKGGNLKIFDTLIEMNNKMKKEKTYKNMTVLHIAAKFGKYEICQRILTGDDFNLLDEKSVHGKNACHFAAEGGYVNILQLLIEKGADAKATTGIGQNIFHIACIYSQLKMCEFISKIDDFHDLLFAKSRNGWNATLHAAKNGDPNILKFLRDKNVEFVHKSNTERNALHIACDNGKFDACKCIVKLCATLLEATDEKGRHAGHFAVRSGNMQILQYLEKEKLDVTRETTDGMNILHMACLHCQYKMCTYILEKYPELNVLITKKGMTTAHFVAVRGNNKGHEREMFQALINADDKVDVKKLTHQKNSVLTLAIKYENYEFAQYLLQSHSELLAIPDAINPRNVCNEDDFKMKSILDKFCHES